MAARFDLNDLAIRGKEQLVVSDVAVDQYAGVQAAVSPNGTLVFLRGHRVKPYLPVWVDLNGQETPTRLPAARYRLFDISRDGKKLLLTRFHPGTRWSTVSHHLDEDAWQELGSGDEPNAGAVWSPDGATVALTANTHNERFENIYLKHGNQELDQPLLPPAEFGRFPQSWSKEANAIVFVHGYDTRTLTDISVVPADGGAAQCFACTELEEHLPAFSPDGKWIAYTARKIGGESNIYVKVWPKAGAPIRVSPDGGRNSLWDPSGRKLYYFRQKEMWEVSFNPHDGRPGPARRLFAGRYQTGELWHRNMVLSPDGKRFLLLKEVDDPPEWKKIHVVRNWFSELRRLAPPAN
jgi:dipeptidyl aminopeptidase/acylaminoacyl peptidase